MHHKENSHLINGVQNKVFIENSTGILILITLILSSNYFVVYDSKLVFNQDSNKNESQNQSSQNWEIS